MKLQSKINRVVNVGDIFLYEKAELMFTTACLKTCFQQMTTEQYDRFTKKEIGKFSIDYCVCMREINQTTITRY